MLDEAALVRAAKYASQRVTDPGVSKLSWQDGVTAVLLALLLPYMFVLYLCIVVALVPLRR